MEPYSPAADILAKYSEALGSILRLHTSHLETSSYALSSLSSMVDQARFLSHPFQLFIY